MMTKKLTELDEDVRDFKPGIYQHYKGGMYRAVGLVAHHETRRPWVLYLSLTQGSMNIRPLRGTPKEPDGWLDPVDAASKEEGVVRQYKVPRFVLVNVSLDGLEGT